MTILVSDTSVLIDLERGELIASAFKLSATFAVPDVLYERELRDYGGEELVRATLLSGLERWLLESKLTQAQAAKTLRITQVRVSDIR
jgi:predicted XRE-type DNA-binding protein